MYILCVYIYGDLCYELVIIGIDHGDILDSDSENEDEYEQQKNLNTDVAVMAANNNTIFAFNTTGNNNSNNNSEQGSGMDVQEEVIPRVDADGWETVTKPKRKPKK